MSGPESDPRLRRNSHAHGSRHDRGTLTLAGRACAGELAPGEAMTLRVRRAGRLQVHGERLWLTFWHAAEDDSVRGGDHFVDPGQALTLQPNQALVIEPSAGRGQVCRSVRFHWQPAPGALGALRQDLATALHALADRLAPPSLRTLA